MPKRNKAEVLGVSYWYRAPHGWYGDFRRHGGSGRKALGIEDPGAPAYEVQQAIREHLDVLEGKKTLVGDKGSTDPELQAYCQHYLDQRQDLAEKSRREYNVRLSHFIRYFGPKTRLSAVDVAGLNRYVAHRRQQGRADTTIQCELNALSAMYSYAVSEDAAEGNPVAQMAVKPTRDTDEPEWLEIGEAARLIEAAFNMPESSRQPSRFGELVATLLLTGGRFHEVAALIGRDVDFEHDVVHFRPNRYKPEKSSKRQVRTVPLWPQLRDLLSRNADICEQVSADQDGALLFPSYTGEPLTRIHASFATALEEAGIDRHITPKATRHTYASTRLQTLDHGEPVSPYTVARELGHSGLNMIERHYGHLQKRRVRLPEVRYEESDVAKIERAREGTNG